VYVSDPGDLTGIGIGVTTFLRQFYREGTSARLGVHSVSTMLMYADLRRVFRLLHVLTARIDAADSIGVFALDDSVDSHEQSVLRQPFDGVVELRETDEGRELRCRGVDAGPRSWTPVSLR
jgi:KaiC/GvpD/RAD55 family RecA-like ATPase